MENYLNSQKKLPQNLRSRTIPIIAFCFLAVFIVNLSPITMIDAETNSEVHSQSSAGDIFFPMLFRPEFAGQGLLFITDRDGDIEIFSMRVDGAEQMNLSNNDVSDTDPEWSPDGTKIVFESYADGVGARVFVMDADGSDRQLLTQGDTGLTRDPSWSPDGRQIVYTSNEFGVDSGLAIIEAEGTNSRPLTLVNADLNPDWSPDGTKIVFTHLVGGNHMEIFAINADGTNRVQLTNNSRFNNNAVWSPDGTKIAFSSDHTGNWEVYVMNADGSGQVNLTNHAAIDAWPVWSPDGDQIAFSSDRDGDYEVYVMNADGSAQTRITYHPSFDSVSDWR